MSIRTRRRDEVVEGSDVRSDTTSRGGFGQRGEFGRLRDQLGRPIDEHADQSRNYSDPADQWDAETQSRFHGEPDIDLQHQTDEDDADRRLRGLRGDYDNRARQFVGHTTDTDDLRGQFRRSRDDGELGRRGRIEDVPGAVADDPSRN